ncbi:hypothetical protein Nepgr_012167 [Nepenthes gracilis]|uniref:RING-type domain-containing protein n=1 Tax=Nepenthes gracilis TaxID=150966 RepID=A0AAD3SGH8_NEPGR|nr:hypothetical protein Nepgr_012167 [Nepenthes gracilis]
MPTSTDFVDEQLTASVNNLHVDDQGKMKGVTKSEKGSRTTIGDHQGVCAICLDEIVLQETALVKGCEHAYCVTCILQWASFSEHPKCPQCKHPFEFLNVHRAPDGSVLDSMFTESVCLLLTATWFRPLFVEHQDDTYDELEEFYLFDDDYENAYESDYQDEDDEEDEVYLNKSSGVHISNLRWGDDGYIQSGRQEAKPVYKSSFQDLGAGSSREPKKKEICKATIGRRAKRALKREAAVKASTAAASGSAG